MTVRRSSLLIRGAAATALLLVLAGCTKGGQFDPTTIFNNDMFDNKKKLQGDREPVFPNGVPGTTSGVPADLVKGYQPPPDQADADANPPPPAPEPAKPKPKPKVAHAPAHPPTRISVGPASSQSAPAQQAAPPPATPPQQAAPPSQSVWPDPPRTNPQ